MATYDFPSEAEREAAKAAQYTDFGTLNLMQIRLGVDSILKLLGRGDIFDEYTLHDMSHIDEMLRLLGWLVPEETKALMKPADWLLIVLACYFHDMGLLVTRHEYQHRAESGFPKFRDEVLLAGDRGLDYRAKLSYMDEDERERFYYEEFVRRFHAERIFHWINGHAAQELGITDQAVQAINDLLDGLQVKFREDLALICRSHHSNDLDDLSTYVIRRAYGQEPETHGNLQYAALLLRTADLLHMRSNRVPSIMFKLIDPANPKSQEEWVKQMGVRAVLPKVSLSAENKKPDTIEVQADFREASGFFGLSAYLDYVGGQLRDSWQWGQAAARQGSEYDFPWRYVDSSQIEARGFLKKQFKFELDRSRILELLTGHTLYNDSLVAIREILQNSLDAVRFYHHTHKDEPMGAVHVRWNRQSRQLIIRDTGTGMTQQIIEDHLLTVGSSYYQSAQVREQYADFSSISRFGIGVLSIFMISDEIEFLTVHPDEELARSITLPSAQHRYLIKTLQKDDERVKDIGTHGTQVTLTVRASAVIEDMLETVRHWVVVPRCRVTVAVDDREAVEVGFPDVRSALASYVNQYVPPPTGSKKIKTEARSVAGVDLAYSVVYSPFLDSWDFLQRDSDRLVRPMSVASRRVNSFRVPGVCVEGIRVDARSPGFATVQGPWALANITGAGSPRTNVARSDLERTEELEKAISSVYRMFVEHPLNELKRLTKSGAGLLKGVREASWILSLGLDRYSKLYPTAYDNCVDEVPILAMEGEETVQQVSRKTIQDLGGVWTVDSPLLGHVQGLAESLGVTLPAAQIMERLTNKKLQTLPTPRLLERSIKPLRGFEVAEARVDRENQRIDFFWKREAGRWVNFGKIVPLLRSSYRDEGLDDEFYYDYIEEQIIRTVSGSKRLDQFWLMSGADVHLQCPGIDMIEWRGRTFILPSSPIAMLYEIFGLDERFAEWARVLLQSREIPSDKAPLLKEHLQTAGKSPQEILPKLVISPERTFGIDYFQRTTSTE